MEAYRRDTQPTTLLEDEYFARVVGRRRGGVAAGRRRRRAVRRARSRLLVSAGVLRLARLGAPAGSLIQGQRDFFGAHTYKRVDKPGTFHTLWSDDRSEVEMP